MNPIACTLAERSGMRVSRSGRRPLLRAFPQRLLPQLSVLSVSLPADCFRRPKFLVLERRQHQPMQEGPFWDSGATGCHSRLCRSEVVSSRSVVFSWASGLHIRAELVRCYHRKLSCLSICVCFNVDLVRIPYP